MHNDDPCLNVLMEHLGINEDQAWHWADYIAKRTFGSGTPFFDLKHDIENLENIARALQDLSKALDHNAMTDPASTALNMNIIFGEYAEAIQNGGVKANDLPSHLFNKAIDTADKKAAAWLHDIEDHLPKIIEGIQRTKRQIVTSKNARIGTSRINVDGIMLVEAARVTWTFVKQVEAPKHGLNPASPFGNFLCDLFEAYEVEGDPRSAFRAWSNTVEGH